jgi:cysteinyl-tRNA synthetase
MSKSLGNFFLVSDVIKEFDPIVIRFFLISSHYRKSINYSLDNMQQIEKNYNKILNTITKINEINAEKVKSKGMDNLISKIKNSRDNIINALDDDFNTPVAIAVILDLIRELNQAILEKKIPLNEKFKDVFFSFIKDIDDIFGLFPTLKKELSAGIHGQLDDKDKLIHNLLEILSDTRKKLRKKKIYDLSDEIREKIRALGLNVEDN